MRALRNLIVALALVPAIAACSAGGNSALPSAPVNAAAVSPTDTDANANEGIELSDNYTRDAAAESAMVSAAATSKICPDPNLSCVNATILTPLIVSKSGTLMTFSQGATPTQVKAAPRTVLTIAAHNLGTNTACSTKCIVIAEPVASSSFSQGGFVEGVTVQNGKLVPISRTARPMGNGGTFYLYLAREN